MPENANTGEIVESRRAAAYATRVMTSPRVREITPADGSVARPGRSCECVLRPCQRWIDCHDAIPPEVALGRHRELLH